MSIVQRQYLLETVSDGMTEAGKLVHVGIVGMCIYTTLTPQIKGNHRVIFYILPCG